jgi:hypothetical protein
VNAQAKAISEVVKDFEQSLQNLRPSTRAGLPDGRQSGDQSRSPGALAVSVGYRTIGLARRIPHRKESTNLAFLKFLGGGELKELVSDEG